MAKLSEHHARGPKNAFPNDDNAGTVRHPAVARILERIDKGDPIFGRVMQDMFRVRKLGVEVTPEIVDQSIAHAREALKPKPVFVPKKGKTPERTARPGRFGHVENPGEVVYYMRIGDRVKIGTSTNLRTRLEAINPEELLALERGGVGIERIRHQEFAALRTHGEWFRLEGLLLAHIEKLRALE